MAKAVAIFMLAALILLSLGFWAISGGMKGGTEEVLMLAIGLVVVGFGVYKGLERVRSAARKEPHEDELSRQTLMKSASLSYYISLYFWLLMMYVSDRTAMENHTLIGMGIGGMAIIYLGSWIWVKVFGLRND